MRWYPIFLREMLLFRRKLLRGGYLISSLFVPLLFLLAFGLGLGGTVRLPEGTYLQYLLPGLVAMTSMTNSYSWIAMSINLGRIYSKTFQVLVQAPVSPASIVLGEALAGVVRGLFASAMIVLVGIALGGTTAMLSLPFLLALLINCFLFASLGVAVGLITRSHEEATVYSNFVVLPMAFFSGTFFPIETIPSILKGIVLALPLTHANVLMRRGEIDLQALISLGVMVAYAGAFFLWALRLVRNYSE